MIDYGSDTCLDPWGFHLVLSRSGSVFPKAFHQAFPAVIINVVVFIFFNDPSWSGFGAVGASYGSFQFVLGFLVVFRTQLAYSRYWEGTTLMGRIRGQWFNATSNLFAFCTSNPEKVRKVNEFQAYLVRLVSLLHCAAIQQVADMDEERFEILDIAGIDPVGLAFLDTHHEERCLILLQWIQRLIYEGQKSGVLDAPAPIISRAYQEFGQGIVNVQDAEKLSFVKFPFPFAQALSLMLFVASIITPIMLGVLIKHMHWSIIFSFISVFALYSINNIAQEIELPFGDDPNDLPVAELQFHMNKLLNMLLVKQTQMPPKFTFNESTLGQKVDTYMLDDDINLFDMEKMIRAHTLAQSDTTVDATVDEGKGIPGNEQAVAMDCLNGNHPRPHSNHSPKKEGHVF